MCVRLIAVGRMDVFPYFKVVMDRVINLMFCGEVAQGLIISEIDKDIKRYLVE